MNDYRDVVTDNQEFVERLYPKIISKDYIYTLVIIEPMAYNSFCVPITFNNPLKA